MRLEEELGIILRVRRMSVAVAESVTGGLVSDLITDVPGSSEYFLGGVIAYSNESKTRLLGVRKETLEAYGAVSGETAREMAAGIRNAFSADVGAAATGIAGPSGATPTKPVGTVFLAVDLRGKRLIEEKAAFPGGRAEVKRAGANRLIGMIISAVEST